MTKRFTHDGIVIVDHLKKDLIYIDGDENLLDLAEYVDRLQYENDGLKQENEQYKEKIERVFRIAYNETKLTETTKKTLQKIAEILDIEL